MGLDLKRPRWRALAASVAGTAHVRAGRPCADASAVRILESGKDALLVAVAADGAGAAAHAAAGARLACDAILEQAELWSGSIRNARARRRPSRRGAPTRLQAFSREDMLRFVTAARTRVVGTARRKRLDPREFSCTLLAALIDTQTAVFFQIGDGAIVYQTDDGRYVPALWPQSGEYANCTFFLTDEDAVARVQGTKLPSVNEVALFTDGLERLALRFGSREAHGPFFEPMFARLREERAARPRRLAGELRLFLDSAPVNARTDDDKTLVMATRLAAGRQSAFAAA